MNKAIVLGAALAVVGMTGCSDADTAGFSAYGQSHIIKQYSGGQLIGQWESTGKIENEEHSDGYYFKDSTTGKLIMVSGTVQITVK